MDTGARIAPANGCARRAMARLSSRGGATVSSKRIRETETITLPFRLRLAGVLIVLSMATGCSTTSEGSASSRQQNHASATREDSHHAAELRDVARRRQIEADVMAQMENPDMEKVQAKRDLAVPHVVPFDITAPMPIQAPYTTPFATQSREQAAQSVATTGQTLPPPWAPLVHPPLTAVGAALSPPGQRMPDPNALVVNSLPPWERVVASDPYFTPIEVVNMAQSAGYLDRGWFQHNTPVISYESSRGDGRGDITTGYLGQGGGVTPFTFYEGTNPYGY